VIKGRLVTLNESGIKFHHSTGGAQHRRKFPWRGRTGTIVHVTKNPGWVRVRWEGNKFPCDGIHTKFLERVLSEAP
jgi:hypothetical protein